MAENTPAASMPEPTRIDGTARLRPLDPRRMHHAYGGVEHETPGHVDGCLMCALKEILLVESGRGLRHNMTDEEMWQAMTDIARAALEEARRGH